MPEFQLSGTHYGMQRSQGHQMKGLDRIQLVLREDNPLDMSLLINLSINGLVIFVYLCTLDFSLIYIYIYVLSLISLAIYIYITRYLCIRLDLYSCSQLNEI